MKKTRIVKIQTPSRTYFQIQEKHWLFGWREAGDAWNCYPTSFTTLEEAQDNVKWFNGSIPDYEVVK